MKYQSDKAELLRCKKGQLKSNDLIIPFDFGIVYESDGILTLDISISDEFKMSGFARAKIDIYFGASYIATCNSDENDKLEIRRLHFSNLDTGINKGYLTCYDRLIKTKQKKTPYEKAIVTKKNSSLHYLELEGLKMQFSDRTEQIKARGGVQVKDFNNSSWDHTDATLVYKGLGYSFLYYKSDTNDNIVVEFHRSQPNNLLPFHIYQEFKLEYTYCLSLLNGAEVRIRKEFTGDYYSLNEMDAHVTIIYSFKTVNNERHSSYIPLNDPFSRKDNIINKFFSFSFDKYVEWNNKIDLNSIIFYYINSVQSKSMQEVFFVQMIAFERLTTLYAEYKGEKEIYLPSNQDFQEIKVEFLAILEKYKPVFGETYNVAKSKLSNLNQVKRLSTTDKMFRLIRDVNILITPEIEKLIEQVRHKTIHRGELESGSDGINDFYLLGELIQETILRLIDYNGLRESMPVS